MNNSQAIQSVNHVINSLRDKNIVHLSMRDEFLNGNSLTLEGGNQVVNFGSCSYLGLEFENSIRDAAKQSIDNFGTQFSSSRAYLSVSPYKMLEDRLEKIFLNPVIVMPTTTLGHIAAIPVLVDRKDAVIIDHQVHTSVQNAVKLVKSDGTHVEMLRHNRMDLLEKRIIDLSKKHSQVWYMGDGVYSMFGDFAPISEIERLLDKYDNFNYYVDDAHGMSCYGERGEGFVLSQIKQHSRMVVATSFAKAFATGGGALILPDQATAQKIKNCGSTFITSGPMQPAAIGAAIAAADIHLSSELKLFQNRLNDNLQYTHLLLEKFGLPNLAEAKSPIFFVGVGLPKIGSELISKMLADGFMMNIGIFPAVPMKNTGVRFTITALHTYEQIEEMVLSLAKNFYQVLDEMNYSIDQIKKDFKIGKGKFTNETVKVQGVLRLEKFQTITEIAETDWDSSIGQEGAIDWNGMKVLENSFHKNNCITENWTFDYIVIRNQKDEIVLTTFLTSGIMKDDMLADPSISRNVEIGRATDKLTATSKFLAVGSLVTEGKHLYLKGSKGEQNEALKQLFTCLDEFQVKYSADTILLRDFNNDNPDLDDLMIDNGYVKILLPENFKLDLSKWTEESEFIDTLSKRSKKHFKQNVRRFIDCFETRQIENPSEDKLHDLFQLYLNVQTKGMDINTFSLPYKLFQNMALNSKWEIIELLLNPDEKNGLVEKKTVGVIFAYKGQKTFVGGMVGVDYGFNKEYGVYRHLIYKFIERAKVLGYKDLDFGFCAGIEKKKFGAVGTDKVAYIQTKDNFNFEALLTNSFGKEERYEAAIA